jgi:broad specificity phosphatase PhoE
MRHAHTDYNQDKRYAGTLDISLNDHGVQQILAIKEHMSRFHLDITVTSTLKRTVETAEQLLEGKVPLIRSALCNERCFGVMEGKTWDEVQTLDPPVLFIDVGNDLHSVNPLGGEPFEEVWERAKHFHKFLLDHFEGQSILVISHGVFLQMFHGLLKGLSCIEALAVYPGNLELNSFEWQTGLKNQQTIQLLEEEEVRW